jgi:hypothetical protein
MKDDACYIFVIKTNKYAGNFEREMTAFSTGMIGECGVGQEAAIEFLNTKGQKIVDEFDDVIYMKPDEHGCCRPTSIWGEPEYNDVAIFFTKKPSKNLINIIKERATIYAINNKIRVHDFKLIKESTSYEEVE